MFDHHQLRLSRAFRAVHGIPLWTWAPGAVAIATADDHAFIARMASVLGESTLKAAAHEAIVNERDFCMNATDAEYRAVYEVAA